MQIHRIPLLEVADCAKLVAQVEQLRPHYCTGVEGFFYTLGNALYQSDDNEGYYRKARYYNEMLFSRFRGLYGLLLKQLGIFLNAEVGYAQGLSLPGFHIFELGRKMSYEGGGRHFDLSHQKLFPDNLSQTNYSFTLPLELPAAGCGLDIWQLHHSELTGLTECVDRDALADKRAAYFVPYQAGELVIFPGDYLHQIAKVEPVAPMDRRITFQGHCLFRAGYWRIYF